MLKKKTLTLSAMVALALILVVPVQAYANFGVYGYVDKIQYDYGESGKLMIWIVNEGDEPLILHNITVYYPWHMVLPWEGNFTEGDIDEVIPVGGNMSYTFDFTVPDDFGPISSGQIETLVVTDKRTRVQNLWMNIVSPPYSMSLQNMDNLITLITVLVILVIIAAIIIAAAVFLSGRRPTGTWTKE